MKRRGEVRSGVGMGGRTVKRGFYCVKQEGGRVKEIVRWTVTTKHVAKLLDNNIN